MGQKLDKKHEEKMWLILLNVFIFIRSGEAKQRLQYTFEKALHTDLLKEYDKDVRPVKSRDHPMQVEFDLKMQRLVSYRWVDPQLEWNETNYGYTSAINIGASLIWTPDVVLYNTALETSLAHTDMYKTKVVVKSRGEVIWNAPVTWKISCSSDVTWFPIDEQECTFSFGSWSYTNSQINLTFLRKPEDKSKLFSGVFVVESGEWSLLDMTAMETEVIFDCCPEPFAAIEYTVTISRLSLYYFIYIILPLMSLAFLFLLIFHIPHDSGERMGFGVTILLSITVYLLVISEKLPEKSDSKPMLGIVFISVFYVLCCALGLGAMTIMLARRKSKPPDFMLYLINHGCWKARPTTPVTIMENRDAIIMMNMKKDKGTGSDVEQLDNWKNNNICLKEDYNDEWVRITRYLDKRFSIIFFFLLVLLPFITILSLPTTHKGSLSM